MTISFDIDNTLIPYSNEFEVEKKGILPRLLKAEPLRKGTIQLFKELENRGHEIWIYTTSFRSPNYLKRTFKSYGLHPSRIINQKINQKQLRKHNCTASKKTKLFGIDLHQKKRGTQNWIPQNLSSIISFIAVRHPQRPKINGQPNQSVKATHYRQISARKDNSIATHSGQISTANGQLKISS